MTTGTEDQLLREVLAHEADRHEVPAFEVDAVVAGARARRRRGRALVGGAVLAVTVVAASAMYLAQGLGSRDATSDIVPQGTRYPVPWGTDVSAPMVRVPGGTNAPVLSIPFCEVRPDQPTDVLHVDGTAYATACAYARPHHRYLWYHAGRTVMSSPDGIQVLVGDRLVRVSHIMSHGVRISMDGRYLAWFQDGALVVHDLVVGRPVGEFTMPEEVLSTEVQDVLGTDWSGRTYVQADGRLWVHDLDPDRWSEVRGLPPDWGAGDWKELAYLTPQGLAVESESLVVDDPGARSVEGRVTRDGVFEPVRNVPLGTAVWSTDRSHVVQLSREGFTAHPADDLDTVVRMDLPVDPADVPDVGWDAQWESGSTVIVTWAVWGSGGEVSGDAFVTSRCSATSGACVDLPTEVDLPLSALAHPGG